MCALVYVFSRTCFDRYGFDKVAATNEKINQLKNQMAKNVEQQLDNMENLEITEGKASE